MNTTYLHHAVLRDSTNPYAIESSLNVVDSKFTLESVTTCPPGNLSDYRKMKAKIAAIVARTTRDPEIQRHIATKEKRVTVLENFILNKHLSEDIAELYFQRTGVPMSQDFRARYEPIRSVTFSYYRGVNRVTAARRFVARITEPEIANILSSISDPMEAIHAGRALMQLATPAEALHVLPALPAAARDEALCSYMLVATDFTKAHWEQLLESLSGCAEPGARDRVPASIGRATEPTVPFEIADLVLSSTDQPCIRAAALSRVIADEQQFSDLIDRVRPVEVANLLPLPIGFSAETLEKALARVFEEPLRFAQGSHPFWRSGTAAEDADFERLAGQLTPRVAASLTMFAFRNMLTARPRVLESLLGRLLDTSDEDVSRAAIKAALTSSGPTGVVRTILLSVVTKRLDKLPVAVLRDITFAFVGDREPRYIRDHEPLTFAVTTIDRMFPDKGKADAWQLVFQLWDEWAGDLESLLDTVEAAVLD